jgi:hypothetical protein
MCVFFSKCFNEKKFFVCKAKSSFAQTHSKYLSHIVDKQGIRPNPTKVEAVQTRSVSKNVRERYSFFFGSGQLLPQVHRALL